MNAEAILQAQGWRGRGHTLHPSDNGVGLSKPLGLSRNTDRHGIGQPKHHTSDQWWLTALDEKLKGLDTSQKGRVVQSTTTGKLDAVSTVNAAAAGRIGKYAGVNGLYAMFVRGGHLAGTRTLDGKDTTDTTPVSDGDSDASLRLKTRATAVEETREERKAKRAERRLRKQARALRRAEKARRRKEKEDAAAETGSVRTEEKTYDEPGRTRNGAEKKEERRLMRVERKSRKQERRKRRTLEDGG